MMRSALCVAAALALAAGAVAQTTVTTGTIGTTGTTNGLTTGSTTGNTTGSTTGTTAGTTTGSTTGTTGTTTGSTGTTTGSTTGVDPNGRCPSERCGMAGDSCFPPVTCQGPGFACGPSFQCVAQPEIGANCMPRNNPKCYSSTDSSLTPVTDIECAGAVGSEVCSLTPYLPGGWCCAADAECVSGVCAAGVCGPPPAATTGTTTGVATTTGSTTGSATTGTTTGPATTGTTTATTTGSTTGVVPTVPCTVATSGRSTCEWGDICVAGTCQALRVGGAACNATTPCAGGWSCHLNTSTCIDVRSVADGAACDQSLQCDSGWCNENGLCSAAPALGANSTAPTCVFGGGGVDNCPPGPGPTSEICSCNSAQESKCMYATAIPLLAAAPCKNEELALAACQKIAPGAPVGARDNEYCCAEFVALLTCTAPVRDALVTQLGAPRSCFGVTNFAVPTCPTTPACSVVTTGTTAALTTVIASTGATSAAAPSRTPAIFGIPLAW